MLSIEQKARLSDLRRQLSLDEKKELKALLEEELKQKKAGFSFFCCNCHSTCMDECNECFKNARVRGTANVKVSTI